MNPNSAHQLWSKWIWVVAAVKHPKFEEVKLNCARFARKVFGNATAMKIDQKADNTWTISLLTEGHPVHDPRYLAYLKSIWVRFLKNGFGEASKIIVDVKLTAGSRQDGSIAEQMIIIPAINLGELTDGKRTL